MDDIMEFINWLRNETEDKVSTLADQYNKLMQVDSGQLSSDPDVIALRYQEDRVKQAHNDSLIELQLLTRVLKALGTTKSSDNYIMVPEYFHKYVSFQRKNTNYKDNPGLLVQDMFISMGEDELPGRVSDWVNDNPNDAINAVMQGYKVKSRN